MSCDQMCFPAFGLVGFKQQLTCWGLKEDWTLKDKVVTLQNTKYRHRYHFYSSEMIAHYFARRGREVVLSCSLNYYLSYGFSFSSTASKLYSLFLKPIFFRSLLPSHFIIFCNCSTLNCTFLHPALMQRCRMSIGAWSIVGHSVDSQFISAAEEATISVPQQRLI